MSHPACIGHDTRPMAARRRSRAPPLVGNLAAAQDDLDASGRLSIQVGKICYLEIPAKDVEVSSAFYVKLFGWNVRTRGDGAKAFDDSTGAVSGSWVVGRAPAREPGMLPYVMVEDIDRTLQAATKIGGEIVTARTALGPGDAYATLRDPAGNLLGLYQNR